MIQGGLGAGAEIIPLRIRGGGLAGQSLEKMGSKIIAVEREVVRINVDMKMEDFTTVW
jgi:hypothetical protein